MTTQGYDPRTGEFGEVRTEVTFDHRELIEFHEDAGFQRRDSLLHHAELNIIRTLPVAKGVHSRHQDAMAAEQKERAALNNTPRTKNLYSPHDIGDTVQVTKSKLLARTDASKNPRWSLAKAHQTTDLFKTTSRVPALRYELVKSLPLLTNLSQTCQKGFDAVGSMLAIWDVGAGDFNLCELDEERLRSKFGSRIKKGDIPLPPAVLVSQPRMYLADIRRNWDLEKSKNTVRPGKPYRSIPTNGGGGGGGGQGGLGIFREIWRAREESIRMKWECENDLRCLRSRNWIDLNRDVQEFAPYKEKLEKMGKKGRIGGSAMGVVQRLPSATFHQLHDMFHAFHNYGHAIHILHLDNVEWLDVRGLSILVKDVPNLVSLTVTGCLLIHVGHVPLVVDIVDAHMDRLTKGRERARLEKEERNREHLRGGRDRRESTDRKVGKEVNVEGAGKNAEDGGEAKDKAEGESSDEDEADSYNYRYSPEDITYFHLDVHPRFHVGPKNVARRATYGVTWDKEGDVSVLRGVAVILLMTFFKQLNVSFYTSLFDKNGLLFKWMLQVPAPRNFWAYFITDLRAYECFYRKGASKNQKRTLANDLVALLFDPERRRPARHGRKGPKFWLEETWGCQSCECVMPRAFFHFENPEDEDPYVCVACKLMDILDGAETDHFKDRYLATLDLLYGGPMRPSDEAADRWLASDAKGFKEAIKALWPSRQARFGDNGIFRKMTVQERRENRENYRTWTFFRPRANLGCLPTPDELLGQGYLQRWEDAARGTRMPAIRPLHENLMWKNSGEWVPQQAWFRPEPGDLKAGWLWETHIPVAGAMNMDYAQMQMYTMQRQHHVPYRNDFEHRQFMGHILDRFIPKSRTGFQYSNRMCAATMMQELASKLYEVTGDTKYRSTRYHAGHDYGREFDPDTGCSKQHERLVALTNDLIDHYYPGRKKWALERKPGDDPIEAHDDEAVAMERQQDLKVAREGKGKGKEPEKPKRTSSGGGGHPDGGRPLAKAGEPSKILTSAPATTPASTSASTPASTTALIGTTRPKKMANGSSNGQTYAQAIGAFGDTNQQVNNRIPTRQEYTLKMSTKGAKGAKGAKGGRGKRPPKGNGNCNNGQAKEMPPTAPAPNVPTVPTVAAEDSHVNHGNMSVEKNATMSSPASEAPRTKSKGAGVRGTKEPAKEWTTVVKDKKTRAGKNGQKVPPHLRHDAPGPAAQCNTPTKNQSQPLMFEGKQVPPHLKQHINDPDKLRAAMDQLETARRARLEVESRRSIKFPQQSSSPQTPKPPKQPPQESGSASPIKNDKGWRYVSPVHITAEEADRQYLPGFW